MGHADFRVGGKIFATLGYPDEGWGIVKLTPEQQGAAVQGHPGVFVPAAGNWGTGGATTVLLKGIRKEPLRAAILAAWRNVAPKDVLKELDGN